MQARIPSARSRRGTAYVFVLGAAALATTAGITAVMMHGVRLQRVELTRQGQRASLDAQSTLEYVVHVLDSDPLGKSWRTNQTFTLADRFWMGESASEVDVVLLDPVDNDLSNNESDPVEANVRVTMGPVTQAFSLRMTPVQEALNGLDYAVVAKGSITTTVTGTIHASGPMSQNEAGDRDWSNTGSISQPFSTSSTNSSSASSNQPAGGTSSQVSTSTNGSNQQQVSFNASTSGGSQSNSSTSTAQQSTTNQTSPTMSQSGPEPTPPPVIIPENAIIDSYIRRGTLIRVTDIGSHNISGLVLGPGRNPLGEANPDGIYVLDCENMNVVIQNSRIYGTLVAINPGSNGITIRGNTCLQTASESQPALLVRGNAVVDLTGGDFTESTVSINMNPPGVPDRGVTDLDMLDEYPRHVRGVVFVTGNVQVTGVSTVQGVLMAGGNVTVSGELRVIHEKPLEFINGMAMVKEMRMQPGSFMRIVD